MAMTGYLFCILKLQFSHAYLVLTLLFSTCCISFLYCYFWLPPWPWNDFSKFTFFFFCRYKIQIISEDIVVIDHHERQIGPSRKSWGFYVAKVSKRSYWTNGRKNKQRASSVLPTQWNLRKTGMIFKFADFPSWKEKIGSWKPKR